MGDLIAWGKRPSRKPLLLYGARQAGKTWLLEEYDRRAFDDVAKVDFMLDERARSLFVRDLNPKRAISTLEVRLGRRIHPERTLVIFDGKASRFRRARWTCSRCDP